MGRLGDEGVRFMGIAKQKLRFISGVMAKRITRVCGKEIWV